MLCISLYCGHEERLKFSFDVSIPSVKESESSYETLGAFNHYDEVGIVLSAESAGKSEVLDKVSVPVLCLNLGKPSELTLADFGRVFTVTFQVLPPPPSVSSQWGLDAKDSTTNLSQAPSTAATSPAGASMQSTSEYTGDHKETAKVEEPQRSASIHHQPQRRDVLTIRLSDIYRLLRTLIYSLTVTPTQAMVYQFNVVVAVMDRFRSLVSMLLGGVRMSLTVVVDLAWDTIVAADATIFECLQLLDDAADSCRSLVSECLTLVYQQIESTSLLPSLRQLTHWTLAASRPAWNIPLYFTGPVIRFSVRLSQPVLQLMHPLFVGPVLQRSQVVRQRLLQYPIVGSFIKSTEAVFDQAVEDVQQELWPTMKPSSSATLKK